MGAIIGTGILTLIGMGVAPVGPAVLISFAIAGLVCAYAALACSELSAMMPAAGSAYSYSYTGLGEIFAWIVGWSLILEYSLVVSTVAVGWSGCALPLLMSVGFPRSADTRARTGRADQLPAVAVIAVVAGLLLLGTREGARINTVLVVVKIATLLLFIGCTLPYFDAPNFSPFMPFG